MSKIGRNKPCPCGSGQKFKKCCGRIAGRSTNDTRAAVAKNAIRQHRAQEAIREHQQGLGKPIVSAEVAGHRIIATGDRLYWSKTWKTFPDFLSQYIKTILGTDWGNAELAKPLADRHVVLQWYQVYCDFQALGVSNSDGIRSAKGTGAVWCFLGLAYSLYLIKHNVDLQDRLLTRLRDPKNFQGAYHELMIANVLIRAGFELVLEDEQDTRTKHCEFSALSKRTHKKYSVEAKMRAVTGVLGKSAVDGGKDGDPTNKVTSHLREALQKPSVDARLIFIDVNSEQVPNGATPPAWVDRAVKRLKDSEVARTSGAAAYIFLTNWNYHRHLANENINAATVAFGYGIDDFMKEGAYPLPVIYQQKQKHIDIYHILESAVRYTELPATFDGRLPSETENGGSRRIIVGEKYFFEDGIGFAEVVSVAVAEGERCMYISVNADQGGSQIITMEMTEQELREYRSFGDAIFGELRRRNVRTDTPLEMFEWLMAVYADYTEEQILRQIAGAPDVDSFKELGRNDLMVAVAERVTWARFSTKQ